MLAKLPVLVFWAATVALLALASPGCVQEGGATETPPLVEEDLSTISQISQADRIYFLKRTHFAFRPSELQTLNQMGYENYLDWMLSLQLDPTLEAQALAATVVDVDFPSEAELSRWWIHLMVHNPNAFQERLALFWHDHFATSSSVLDAQARYWFFDHINLWRTQGTSNLPDLLHAMATDWTMLIWLDGYVSTVNAPNENFGREFWELFTLGADNGYTEADIQEASRAFTGYRRIFVPDAAGPGRDQFIMTFDPNRHDNTSKTIFGQTFAGNGQQEYRDMVNFTLANRQVAEFIVRKVWEEFVYDDPSPNLVADLAGRLRNSGYDLKAFFKTIFLSKAFFSQRARTSIIKNPIEHDIGFMRATGLELTVGRIDSALSATGQRPTQPPTVNGWPSGFFWLSSQAMVERANFLRDCVYYRNEAPQAGYDVSTLIPPNQTADWEVVDRLAFILQVELNPAQRAECITYLNTDRNSGGNFAQPWNFNDAVQKEKKIRGLLYILGQHPTYQLR
ncbi:MAG: DUF1800 domain-containing protein [Planctomycetes bacterium]|nr:DUF1800 domain-containing protein [Planctomycetota bacterium]